MQLEGAGEALHWVRPETLDAIPGPAQEAQEQIHILSPLTR